MGAYFWGYTISLFGSGYVCEKFGGKIIIFYAMIAGAIFTALTPLIAPFALWMSCALRFLIGVCAVKIILQLFFLVMVNKICLKGPIYPGMQIMISKWAPPHERGKFLTALMGSHIGTVITWPIVGLLIESFGWESSYYVSAVIVAICMVVWYFVVFDEPALHPRIKAQEKEYIEHSLSEIIRTKVGKI